jgi:hypothetical protein
MELPTYQQILAEQYEETAKTVLVVANEHEEAIGPDDHHPDELEDQDDFNREQGSHALAWSLPKPAPPKNTSHTDALFNKQTQVRLVNIDSRFRNNLDVSNNLSQKDISAYSTQLYTSSNFLFRLKDPIKNVISVRLSSIELPNVFYAFSTARGNTHFWITYPSRLSSPGSTNEALNRQPGTPTLIQIPDGNWNSNVNTGLIPNNPTPDLGSLCYQVELVLNQVFGTTSDPVPFTVFVDEYTRRVTITNSYNIAFDLDFYTPLPNSQLRTNTRSADFGLGYNLGFRNLIYLYNGVITSFGTESIINTIDTNYVFLTLDPDWKVVIQETPDKTQLFSFAKISHAFINDKYLKTPSVLGRGLYYLFDRFVPFFSKNSAKSVRYLFPPFVRFIVS